MKLSRNVLVGSLATAGIVLGAFAPSLTAQAATTSAVINEDGSVEAVTPNKTVNSLNDKDNPGLAIAYDNGSGTQGDMKTAQATSDANVTVISGILTLDKVPDFGFGTAAAGSKVDLQNNDGDSVDGNDSGILQVTDSRQDSANKTAGFDLAAQLGKFSHKDATSGDSTDANGDFFLALKPVQLTTSTNANDVIQGQKTQDVTLKAGDTTDTNVMSLEPGDYANGAIIAQFAAQTGEPNSNATLAVPSEAGNASKASAVSYHADITWTLTPKAMTKTATTPGN